MTVRPAHDSAALAGWNALRDEGDVFGRPVYLDALAGAGVRLDIASTDRAAAVVAVRPAGPFLRAVPPPLTPFTPVVLDPDDDEAAVHAGRSSLGALASLLADHYAEVTLHLPPTVGDVRPLQWAGWTVEPRFTYRVEPAVAADPATWSAGPRRILRRHEGEYTVEESADMAPDVAGLCAASYRRHDRIAPLSPTALAGLVSRLSRDGLVRVFLARDGDGGPAAGLALLAAPSISYYWVAGGVPGPAMTVLLAAVLARLADERVPLLDFVGANTASIAEFKRRFNPVLVRYHAASTCPSRSWRLLRGFRQMLRG